MKQRGNGHSERGYILVWGMSSLLGLTALGALLLHTYSGSLVNPSRARFTAQIISIAGYANAPGDDALPIMALVATLNDLGEAKPLTGPQPLDNGTVLEFLPAATTREVTTNVQLKENLLQGLLGFDAQSTTRSATVQTPNSGLVVAFDMSASLNVSGLWDEWADKFGFAPESVPPNSLAVRLPGLLGLGSKVGVSEPPVPFTRHWFQAVAGAAWDMKPCSWEEQKLGSGGEGGGQVCNAGDIPQSGSLGLFLTDMFQFHYKDAINTVLGTVAFSFRDVFVNSFSGPLSPDGVEVRRLFVRTAQERLGLPEQDVILSSGDDSSVITLWDPNRAGLTSPSYVFSPIPLDDARYNIQGCFGLSSYLSLIRYATIKTSEDKGSSWQNAYPPGHFASHFAPLRSPLTPDNLGHAFPSSQWQSDDFGREGFFPVCMTPIVTPNDGVGMGVYPGPDEKLHPRISTIEREGLDSSNVPNGIREPIAMVSFPKAEAPQAQPYLPDAITALTIMNGDGTYTHEAVKRAIDQLTPLAGSGSDAPLRSNYLILITDGVPAAPGRYSDQEMMTKLQNELNRFETTLGGVVVTLFLKQPTLRQTWIRLVRQAIEATWGSIASAPPNILALWNEYIEDGHRFQLGVGACGDPLNYDCCGSGGLGGVCEYLDRIFAESTEIDYQINQFSSLMQAQNRIFIEVPLGNDDTGPKNFLADSAALVAWIASPQPQIKE